MKDPLRDRASGRWQGIMASLGIDEATLSGKHCPCPMCGGKDRFRWADEEGRGNYYCSGCGHGDGIDFVMRLNGVDFATAAKEIESVMGEVEFKAQKPKKDPMPRLKLLAKESLRLTGSDPASIYLANRGLSSAPEIRYHPGSVYYEGREAVGTFPLMLAVVRDRAGNNLTYHATYLDNGRKANVRSPKKIFPPMSPIKGGYIQLFGTGEKVCITEGIETALAVHAAFDLPCMVAISAGGMESIQIPDNVSSVIVFGDNDISFTGQKAAYTLAHRLRVMQKLEVEVCIPVKEGFDFCDEWTSKT